MFGNETYIYNKINQKKKKKKKKKKKADVFYPTVKISKMNCFNAYVHEGVLQQMPKLAVPFKRSFSS